MTTGAFDRGLEFGGNMPDDTMPDGLFDARGATRHRDGVTSATVGILREFGLDTELGFTVGVDYAAESFTAGETQLGDPAPPTVFDQAEDDRWTTDTQGLETPTGTDAQEFDLTAGRPRYEREPIPTATKEPTRPTGGYEARAHRRHRTGKAAISAAKTSFRRLITTEQPGAPIEPASAAVESLTAAEIAAIQAYERSGGATGTSIAT